LRLTPAPVPNGDIVQRQVSLGIDEHHSKARRIVRSLDHESGALDRDGAGYSAVVRYEGDELLPPESMSATSRVPVDVPSLAYDSQP